MERNTYENIKAMVTEEMKDEFRNARHEYIAFQGVYIAYKGTFAETVTSYEGMELEQVRKERANAQLSCKETWGSYVKAIARVDEIAHQPTPAEEKEALAYNAKVVKAVNAAETVLARFIHHMGRLEGTWNVLNAEAERKQQARAEAQAEKEAAKTATAVAKEPKAETNTERLHKVGRKQTKRTRK